MGLQPNWGVRIGQLPHGPRNLITDVAGVRVGQVTLSQGPVQTGVTAIIPRAGNCFEQKLCAGAQVFNGFGKSMGLMQIDELGQLETPIVLTNTLSVGTALTALVRHVMAENPTVGRETSTMNPVVMECNDGYLNDIRGLHVQEKHVLDALDNAHAAFEEGAVGAGRGMRSFGLKGGIGSSSRVFQIDGETYTLGVLSLCNHGALRDLTIAGKHIGKDAAALLGSGWAAPSARTPAAYPAPEDKGSVIVVLATDVPLSGAQCTRVARRAIAGLSRTGSNLGHGSGEIALCFSTDNTIPHETGGAFRTMRELDEAHMDLLFRAAAEATEESVLSALFHAEAVNGRDGHRAECLTEVLEKLSKLNGAL